MNKKNIFYWALYDFGNSILMAAFYLHFPQWLVVDRGFSEFWYNALYPLALAAMSLFIFCGFFLLKKISIPQSEAAFE